MLNIYFPVRVTYQSSLRSCTKYLVTMSNESEDEDIHCFLDVELETLRSIYVNELEVLCDEGHPTSVAIQLYPSTADNVDEQYVRMSLILNLSAEYPDVIPDIQIKNPRGLSDEKLQRITDDLFTKAEERKGGTMLFELIERAKDHLTAGNRPSCQCAICLYGFTEQDVFTKTKCYHYFHSHCLSRYVTHQLKEFEEDKPAEHSEVQEASKEVFCPVCRIPISFFVPDDCDFPPPVSAKDDSFIVTEELKQLQNKMADLYEKQKDKGGIIDVEAEKKKFLLEISMVPSKIETVTETEHPSVVQRNTSDEIHQDLNQRKGENDVFPKNLKTPNSIRNNISRNRESTNRYQKHNRKSKDSNYIPGRNSETRNNKGYHARKNDKGHDEEGSKQNVVKETEEQRYANIKSAHHAKNSIDDFGKDTKWKNVKTREISQVAFGTCVVDEISVSDAVDHNTVEKCLGDNMDECVRNKYSERTNSRPSYYKRYQNYNYHSDPHKQKHYVDDGGRKHAFVESHDPPFGVHVGFSNRRSENYHQHPRQSDNYHQLRNAGNYNQRFRYAENYRQQHGRRGSYHEKWQQEDFNCPSRQNDNYRQSRHDFQRKPRYHSRYEQYKPNEGELAPHCGPERTDYGNSKNHHHRKMSPIQNSNFSLEIKSVEKHVKNVQNDFDKVNKEESSQKCSKGNESVDRKNHGSPRKPNKAQHEHHRYQNKYEDIPRNGTNSYMEHPSSPRMFPENSISGNSGDSTSNKISASPDGYPKHPFRRPNSKMYSEVRKSNASQNGRQNYIEKEYEIRDVSPPVVDISNNCNEIFSPVLDSFPANALKGSNNLSIKNTDANHSVSRPPPGFAKKVVYGLPSVKPPPGFSQS